LKNTPLTNPTPLQRLLEQLKDNNLHIWNAEELLANEEDFIFEFIKKFTNVDRKHFEDKYQAFCNTDID
jgi:hypothetical protein